jgi:hypothetical protein
MSNVDGHDKNKDDHVPVWGADAIGVLIGRDARQTHHLLNSGQIKSARKVGGRWTANPVALRKEFGAL